MEEATVEPSEAAVQASARAVLLRAGIHNPTDAELEAARASAKVEYAGAVVKALRDAKTPTNSATDSA